MTACHQTRFPVLLTAKYLTTTICVSAMSIIIQVAILNIYYKEPLVPVPGWLRHVTRCHLCTRGNRRVESEPISNQEKEGDVDESCARKSTEFGKQRQTEDKNITNNRWNGQTCFWRSDARRMEACWSDFGSIFFLHLHCNRAVSHLYQFRNYAIGLDSRYKTDQWLVYCLHWLKIISKHICSDSH